MNPQHSTLSVYIASLATFLLSLMPLEQWMVIGMIVGIAATVITCMTNILFRVLSYRVQIRRWRHK
ncbi:hypothetical protein EWN99_25760 [Salmonella enterica]|uniref:Lysis protein n=1 Tax=Salmonella enterica subsp. salamae TaxID=59202 RepID=A0A5Y1W960_SALER|nr:hypothetical protein [Salmonella enterica]ECC1604506.1 hypothetical protein [Salmonella enterica subsp. salamae]ECD9354088.1 hypothetical protein [Salmonella enterica subsp. salamae]ECL1759074.1 hypothetical protein [Salmonella enterica]EFS2582340.1 hypothetical protein [Salmonella enterica]